MVIINSPLKGLSSAIDGNRWPMSRHRHYPEKQTKYLLYGRLREQQE